MESRRVFTFGRVVIGFAIMVTPALVVAKIASTYAAAPNEFDGGVGAVAGDWSCDGRARDVHGGGRALHVAGRRGY